MNWLKGKHPILVHVVVGLWPMALVFDLLARTDFGNVFVRLSFVSIAAGLVIAIPAVITGALDWSEVKKEKPAWKLGLIHMLLNLLAFSLNALNLGIRLPAWLSATNVTDVQLGLSVVVTVLLAVSGWIGGRLVYEHGISVARQSKEKWREIARAGGADIPEEKE